MSHVALSCVFVDNRPRDPSTFPVEHFRLLNQKTGVFYRKLAAYFRQLSSSSQGQFTPKRLIETWRKRRSTLHRNVKVCPDQLSAETEVRPRITLEEIFAAADLLAAAGIPVTVDAIREITGGSDSTVNKFLRLWKSGRDIPLRTPLSDAEKERLASVQADLACKPVDIQGNDGIDVSYVTQQTDEMTRPCGETEYLKSEVVRPSASADQSELEARVSHLEQEAKRARAHASNLEEENTQLRIAEASREERIERLEEEAEGYCQQILDLRARLKMCQEQVQSKGAQTP